MYNFKDKIEDYTGQKFIVAAVYHQQGILAQVKGRNGKYWMMI